MNILRKYKLYKLGFKIEPKILKIINFLEDSLFNLKKIEIKNIYPDTIFYFKENKFTMKYETKNKILSVINDIILLGLKKKYRLSDEEIREIVRYMVEEHYKMKIHEHIEIVIIFEIDEVEKYYKLLFI